MKTYDMSKSGWRDGNFKRGDHWRSTQVYQCQICHTKTNEWRMGGYPGMGPRILCPGDSYRQHDQLEKDYIRYFNVRKKHLDYARLISKAVQKKKSILLKTLKEEMDLLKGRIAVLRRLFTVVDDVQGIPINAPIVKYYPTSRRDGIKPSIKINRNQNKI